MTAADKLRELLRTRPAMPNVEELTRWWRESGKLVPQLLAQNEVATNLDTRDAEIIEARREARQAREERDAALAELQIERGKRADLRRDLDQVTAALRVEQLQHRTNVEGFEGALAQERHEKDILEQVEGELRACLARANDNHEKFERLWYLGQDELEELRLAGDEREAVTWFRSVVASGYSSSVRGMLVVESQLPERLYAPFVSALDRIIGKSLVDLAREAMAKEAAL